MGHLYVGIMNNDPYVFGSSNHQNEKFCLLHSSLGHNCTAIIS